MSRFCVACSMVLIGSAPLAAQDAAKKEIPSREELIKKLEADLTNVKLIGTFTISGKEDQPPKAEEYTITRAIKLPEGDVWMINSRIKYGNKDVTMPVPVEIKWAGDTPVISLTEMAIPGLGTFTCRVLIYGERYTGTWQHGKVGGLMFGRIEKAGKENDE